MRDGRKGRRRKRRNWSSVTTFSLDHRNRYLIYKSAENLACSLPKILSAEKFFPLNILSAKVFCRLKFKKYPVPSNHIKIVSNKCKSKKRIEHFRLIPKSADTSNWCRKFCLPKFCPIKVYLLDFSLKDDFCLFV